MGERQTAAEKLAEELARQKEDETLARIRAASLSMVSCPVPYWQALYAEFDEARLREKTAVAEQERITLVQELERQTAAQKLAEDLARQKEDETLAEELARQKAAEKLAEE